MKQSFHTFNCQQNILWVRAELIGHNTPIISRIFPVKPFDGKGWKSLEIINFKVGVRRGFNLAPIFRPLKEKWFCTSLYRTEYLKIGVFALLGIIKYWGQFRSCSRQFYNYLIVYGFLSSKYPKHLWLWWEI